MDRTTIVKVTASGQISLPASVRNRWRVSRVAVEDAGDQLLIRPLPDDPVAAAIGSLKRRGAASDAIRTRERRGDAARQHRRVSR